jgi:hypothetical protein
VLARDIYGPHVCAGCDATVELAGDSEYDISCCPRPAVRSVSTRIACVVEGELARQKRAMARIRFQRLIAILAELSPFAFVRPVRSRLPAAAWMSEQIGSLYSRIESAPRALLPIELYSAQFAFLSLASRCPPPVSLVAPPARLECPTCHRELARAAPTGRITPARSTDGLIAPEVWCACGSVFAWRYRYPSSALAR